MPRIFISYRDDSAGHAGRLYDRLKEHFGAEQIFMDIDTNKPGLDFVEAVQQAVGACDGLVAIIGREWEEVADSTGQRRLDDPADIVRLEIATALERGIRVIPVLVQGAQTPADKDLPDALKRLAHQNVLELSDTQFHSDVDRLVEALQAPPSDISTLLPEPRFLQPLVGRDRERDTLRALLDAAVQGQGGLVFITGEAGIGKTRMAAELRDYAKGRGCQWLEGRFDQEGSFPLQPYVEAVRTYLATAQPGSLAAVVGRYSNELVRAFPDIAADLGDVPPPVTGLAEEDPENAQQRLQGAICHLFLSIASQAPLVLFLDDLQWAPAMNNLRALAQRSSGQPLLLVGAYRDMELQEKPTLSRTILSMDRDRLFQPIPLQRLGREEVEQMLAQALGQTSSEQLVDLVYERTEGNPFFVEELVRFLVASGSLSLGDQGWDVTETSGLQMPNSVKLLVEERLERFEPGTRQVLAMAAVAGKEFALSLLQEVTGEEEDALVDAIDHAVEARVLVPRPGVGQEVYAFCDNQVREALYQGIGTARRRRYHLRLGEAIEKVHERHLEEHSDALAHHFLEGNDLEKALDYSIKAGDLAHGHSVFPQARSHYQRAAELLDELGEESERAAHVHAQLGMNLMTRIMRSSAEALRDAEHIQQAIAMFVNIGNLPRAASLYRTLGAAYISGTGVNLDYLEARRNYRSAVDLVVNEEDSLEKAVAYDGLAFCYHEGLELDRAEELARETLRIAEAIQDHDALTLACTELGLVLVQKGCLSEGLSCAERAWTSAQQARTPWFKERAVAHAMSKIPSLGVVDYYQKLFSRWEELVSQVTAQRRYEPGMLSVISAVSVQGGDAERGRAFLGRWAQLGSRRGSGTYAATLAMLGEWQQAEQEFLSQDWTGIGNYRLQAIHAAPPYGHLLLDQGEHRNAEELLRPQWEYCRERGAVTLELNLLPPLIEGYVRLERLQEAHARLERAQEILATPEDWKGLAAGVYLAEALLAEAEARWEEAEIAFQRAVETNQQHGMVYDQARALYQWAVMYLDRSTAVHSPGSSITDQEDRDRGVDLLDQALALFQRCDARKDIERVIGRKEVLTA